MGCVSAAISLVPSENTIPISTSHNTASTFTFKISNTYTNVNDDTLINLEVSEKSNLVNVVNGANTINSENITIGTLPTQIPPSTTSGDILVTINTPKYTAPGIYVGTFKIDGDVADGAPTPTADTFTISLNVIESPSLTIIQTTPLTKTQNGTITVTNTGNTALTGISLVSVGTADFTVAFNDSNFGLNAGASKVIEVSSTNVADLEVGEDNTLNIKSTANNGVVNSLELTLIVSSSFYEGANAGKLEITSLDFSVEQGFGDDDNYWYPFDEIEVNVDLDNKGNWDIENIEILVCLLDKSTGSCVMDEGDMDLSEDDFDLDENEDITVKVTFKVNPKDLDSGNDNYEFYISAVGKIDDSNSAYDGDETGDSDSKDIEIRAKEKFIILDNFDFQEVVQCGADVKVKVDVWNIDDSKINEEEVHILIYNKELGIDKVITDLGDISALDNEVLEFTFKVPQGIEEKTYGIKFTIYDDDSLSSNDIYKNSEDDKAEFTELIKVDGSCSSTESKAVVSANLESGGKAGEDLVVKATITNTEDEPATYTLNVAGYSGWASNAVIDSSVIVVGAGESKDILITLSVNKDASGEQSFNLEAVSGEELVIQQPVAVTIEAKKGFSLDRSIIDKENWYLWGIGALNVVLVIIIIVVAIRVARK